MNKYVFKRYEGVFGAAFVSEKRKLIRGIRDSSVEHVGSTAVKGLGGKNILDIVLGVKRKNPIAVRSRLQRLGYKFYPTSGTIERRFFTKEIVYDGRPVNIHLHLTRYNRIDWKEMIAFRDYLSGHDDALKRYVMVKKKAARMAKGDKRAYMKAKDRFIKGTISKAFKERRWKTREAVRE
jgi:GrpB-like predicted nucleotidyltransferase (UPF0157 family)